MKPFIQVSRKRSLIGGNSRQRAIMTSLGLHKRVAVKVLPNNPSVRGMIKKVIQLLDYVELDKVPVQAKKASLHEVKAGTAAKKSAKKAAKKSSAAKKPTKTTKEKVAAKKPAAKKTASKTTAQKKTTKK